MRTLVVVDNTDSVAIDILNNSIKAAVIKHGKDIAFVLPESKWLVNIISLIKVDTMQLVVALRFPLTKDGNAALIEAMERGYIAGLGFGRTYTNFISGVVASCDNVISVENKRGPLVKEALRAGKNIWLPMEGITL